MFNITDTEVMLMGTNNALARRATNTINQCNAEIRRLRAELAQVQAALKDERAARLFAEYELNKRH